MRKQEAQCRTGKIQDMIRKVVSFLFGQEDNVGKKNNRTKWAGWRGFATEGFKACVRGYILLCRDW